MIIAMPGPDTDKQTSGSAIETLHGTIGPDHPDYGEFYRCRELMAFQFYDAVREAERRRGRKPTERALREKLNDLIYRELAPIVLRYHEQQWPWVVRELIAERVGGDDDGDAGASSSPDRGKDRPSFWARVLKGRLHR